MSFLCFLVFIVSDKKSAVTFLFPYMQCSFSLWLLLYFSGDHSLVLNVWKMMHLCVVFILFLLPGLFEFLGSMNLVFSSNLDIWRFFQHYFFKYFFILTSFLKSTYRYISCYSLWCPWLVVTDVSKLIL